MKRGDLVTVALQGDYGKPRPALIVQSDLFSEHPSVTIMPLTSELRAIPLIRLTVDPGPENGLERRSQIMVDKMQTVARERIGALFGKLDAASMVSVNRSMALFLGFA